MPSEIGRLTSRLPGPAPSPPATRGPARPARAVRAVAFDRSDMIPARPPPEVLAEVDAAWERTAQLAAENRELHFAHDEESGRVIVEVRSLRGDVLRTIAPSLALDVMGGASL